MIFSILTKTSWSIFDKKNHKTLNKEVNIISITIFFIQPLPKSSYLNNVLFSTLILNEIWTKKNI